jgi:hypothetical protein
MNTRNTKNSKIIENEKKLNIHDKNQLEKY